MSDAQPKDRPPFRIWALGILAVAGFVILFWRGPWWFDGAHIRDANLEPADGVVITGFRTGLVALAAGIIAGMGLWYTHKSHRHAEKLYNHSQEQFNHAREKDREQAELTREGQVTGRYVEAIKLLASQNTTERLGGIYGLERIMHDSPKDYPTVVKVLAAFLRQKPSKPMRQVIPIDKQAAFTVLSRRPQRTGMHPESVDLRAAYLVGAVSEGGNWEYANFGGANLTEAILVDIYGPYANFSGAILDRADLHNSAIPGAHFNGASLSATILPGNLEGVWLWDTDLREIANYAPDLIQKAYTNEGTQIPAAEASQ
ncbi:pentapeptide repeat-containing protein [Streptomyces sp. NPDC060005]|uniref:pentapeptide repeat-containing protein n=1 Tax=Streptomyces sp. NPDC060005 TaxID=3347034 RepID=UPI00369F6087